MSLHLYDKVSRSWDALAFAAVIIVAILGFALFLAGGVDMCGEHRCPAGSRARVIQVYTGPDCICEPFEDRRGR